MRTQTLGRTGLQVSVAGLGSGGKSRLGLSQGKDRAHAVSLVHTAMDHGVNFLDTASAYGTESVIAEAIRGRRHDVILSTKVPVSAGDFADTATMIDADMLERRVDESLSALGVDCVDILHLHGVAPTQYDHCRDRLIPRLSRLREAGKIRFTGMTERFAEDTGHVVADRAVRDDLVDVLMVGLNFVNQTAISRVLPGAMDNRQGVLCMFAVRGPLATRAGAQAILGHLIETGEVDPGDIDARDPLGFLLAETRTGSISEAAYRFCRHTAGVHVTLTGTGDAGHLRQNLDAIDAPPLSQATRDRLARIFRNVVSESANATRG